MNGVCRPLLTTCLCLPLDRRWNATSPTESCRQHLGPAHFSDERRWTRLSDGFLHLHLSPCWLSNQFFNNAPFSHLVCRSIVTGTRHLQLRVADSVLDLLTSVTRDDGHGFQDAGSVGSGMLFIDAQASSKKSSLF
jgi:hypothetical protein